ncbi:MAG: hypothetical protein HQK51_18595 [Oligoflexia bacterium]|nr:hypothetical protein [Oligoflexia bacterium]
MLLKNWMIVIVVALTMTITASPASYVGAEEVEKVQTAVTEKVLTKEVATKENSKDNNGKKVRKKKIKMCDECGKPENQCECKGHNN